MKDTFSKTNETGGRLPSLPFALFKEKILGKKYDLSLVFVGGGKIHSLNKKYRKVNSPTDILSFPLNKDSGEIFICEKLAKMKAKEFGRGYRNFIAFLFIHGCVHLLGHEHGKKMERLEEKYRKYFRV
ncbi:MAG: rRNA maturation RNase YbeY [Candidatus Paceibacterota bacterium]|jgi:probable rRNA maturation factor